LGFRKQGVTLAIYAVLSEDFLPKKYIYKNSCRFLQMIMELFAYLFVISLTS